VSGIWQTVFLEPRAPQYLERFEITTDLKKSEAHFDLFTSADGQVLLDITSPTDNTSARRRSSAMAAPSVSFH
jgi:hypothetical protein